VSHTSAHARLDQWRGKRVAVIGRGQSACESAVLLREAGSMVDLVCRGEVRWIGAAPANADQVRQLRRLHELLQAPSAVGPFPWSWLNEWPGLEQRLPDGLRSKIAVRSLRAAAAWWLLPRMEGVKVRAGRVIDNVRPQGSTVALELDSGVQTYDHVLLGTGYRIDISKLGVLSPPLLSAIGSRDGSPLLRAGFESSVPGLHFVGASAVRSFGPLMRFIAGAGYAARSVARAVSAHRARGFAAAGPQAGGYRTGSAQPMSPA
jgi:cation diffusion facilitator CzcD-associated flavoprotein CzcO